MTLASQALVPGTLTAKLGEDSVVRSKAEPNEPKWLLWTAAAGAMTRVTPQENEGKSEVELFDDDPHGGDEETVEVIPYAPNLGVDFKTFKPKWPLLTSSMSIFGSSVPLSKAFAGALPGPDTSLASGLSLWSHALLRRLRHQHTEGAAVPTPTDPIFEVDVGVLSKAQATSSSGTAWAVVAWFSLLGK